MSQLDLRVGSLHIAGNPGTSKTILFVFTDQGNPWNPSSVSLWVGGTITDPTDTDGAVEYPAALTDNEASVTFTVPDVVVPVRLFVDGALATIGRINPSLRGTDSGDDTITVQLGAATVLVTVDGAAMFAALDSRLAHLEQVAVIDPEV